MVLALVLASGLSLPVRVDGEGYLRFIREGRIVYSASADLTVQSGTLGSKGLPLTPAVRVPTNATKIEVDLSGNISATAGIVKTPCGRIVLARFGSKPSEDHGFLVSETRATIGNPGEGLFGVIRTSAAQTAASTVSLKVNKLTEVEAESVTFGDIVSDDTDAKTKTALQGVVFCAAPAIGVDMPVTASRVSALAKRAGLEVDVEVPPGAVIRRKSQPIKQEDFVAAATKAAQAEIGAAIPMTTSDPSQGDFQAPLGQIELKPEDVKTSGMVITVRVAVYVNGGRVNSRSVNLKVDSSAQIKAGAAIKILMKSSGVNVEIPGKARTGGMVGQSVTVVTDNGAVLTGTVLSADRVQVKI